MDNFIIKKQLTSLALPGLLILGLFTAGFAWLNVGVLGNDEGELFLALAPFWIYPYLVLSSVYVGFLAVRLAQGRGKSAWLWGIAGVVLTLLFTLALPSLLSPLFPYPSPEIFAGPALFAFVAPVLAALFIGLLLSIRSKATI